MYLRLFSAFVVAETAARPEKREKRHDSDGETLIISDLLMYGIEDRTRTGIVPDAKAGQIRTTQLLSPCGGACTLHFRHSHNYAIMAVA
jgi:hypothetical protein